MPGKLSILILAACGPATACGAATASRSDTASAAIGAAPPAPAILLPGIVSTGDDGCHATLNPDGKTLYFLESTAARSATPSRPSASPARLRTRLSQAAS